MKKHPRDCKRLDILPAEKLRTLPVEAKQESERFYRERSNKRSLQKNKKDKPVIKTQSRIFRIFSK